MGRELPKLSSGWLRKQDPRLYPQPGAGPVTPSLVPPASEARLDLPWLRFSFTLPIAVSHWASCLAGMVGETLHYQLAQVGFSAQILDKVRGQRSTRHSCHRGRAPALPGTERPLLPVQGSALLWGHLRRGHVRIVENTSYSP